MRHDLCCQIAASPLIQRSSHMAVSSTAKYPAESTTRQLKWLVIVLVISNITIGLFSMVALRQADRRYSDLIDRSVPVLNDLQTLTACAMQAMSATNVDRFHQAGSRAASTANQAFAADLSLRHKVLGEKWIPSELPERDQMQTAGDVFTKDANATLALLERGDWTAAATERETQLRPAFDHYVNTITVAANALEAESRNANASESKRTSKITTVLVGFASWPIIVVVALLLITAAFVLVLMLLFRGREMNDVP
jgi:hypothetical protein